MLLDAKERNVNLFLSIHDEQFTMIEPTRAKYTIRTGLSLPTEGSERPDHEPMRFDSPRPPNRGSSSLCQPTTETVGPQNVQVR